MTRPDQKQPTSTERELTILTGRLALLMMTTVPITATEENKVNVTVAMFELVRQVAAAIGATADFDPILERYLADMELTGPSKAVELIRKRLR